MERVTACDRIGVAMPPCGKQNVDTAPANQRLPGTHDWLGDYGVFAGGGGLLESGLDSMSFSNWRTSWLMSLPTCCADCSSAAASALTLRSSSRSSSSSMLRLTSCLT